MDDGAAILRYSAPMRRTPTTRTHAVVIVCAALVLAASLVAVVGTCVMARAAGRAAATVQLTTIAAPMTSAARSGAAARSPTLRLPFRADMLGAQWQGDAETVVSVRAATTDGSWSRWVQLDAGDDGPDPGSRESRRARSRVGAVHTASTPIWVGAADRVQVRGVGARHVRIVAINASGTATLARRIGTRAARAAEWVLGAAQPSATAAVASPGVHLRSEWGAAPALVEPGYADGDALGVVVHHTAETNRYSCAQVPAILRGIQRYHMRTNGWNDIGYNFLVDRCGGVWEGRGGGITHPVIGAHTMGFNTATVGIAVMGTFTSLRPTSAARAALERTIAWRLDIAHAKPTGSMRLTARSSDRFTAGSLVTVRAVSGHRDLFSTSCPGSVLYGDLQSIARRAWALGGAKVANITTQPTLRSPEDPLDASLRRVAIRAVGSHADMTMTLRLTRASTGQPLFTRTVGGRLLSSVWTLPAAQSVPAWDVVVDVSGTRPNGQRARRYTRPLVPVSADPEFVVTTSPAPLVHPGGDDTSDDSVVLVYTLGAEYRLGAWLVDSAGTRIATLLEPSYVGVTDTPRELVLAVPDTVAPGAYTLQVGLPADDAAGRSIRSFPLTVER